MSTNAAIRSGRPLPFDIDCLEQNYHYAFGTLNLVPITPLQARYQKKSRSFRWCEGIMTFPNGSEMLHCWLEVRVGGKLRTVDFSDTARFYLGAVEFEAAKHQEALNLSHIHYLEGAVVRKRLLTTPP